MQGASREALTTVRTHLGSVAADADADALARAAEGLFSVVTLLDREATLRRTLGDPTTESGAKDALLEGLLGAQVDGTALGLVKVVAAQRWSSPRHLVDALEVLAATASFLAAQKDGQLDRVSDELFRFERILAGAPELRATLTDRGLANDRKKALLDGLLEGKASDSTRRLLETLVLAPRGRTLEDGLAQFAELAADVRSRSLATVTTAVPLDEAQQRRLAASLSAQLGREVQLQIEVDPSVVGGVLVRVGDEVIDGSTRSRLAEARRALA
ncbi:MAG TPA: F0F1 ATP synthase subunit delta [Mycobacteriales bacterium]|nr:F0F1 ATP synthase subunit delta [Mycobacteriales bacterium]